MKKTYLILIILTLVIGFAAVSTNLVLSGKLNIGFNDDEFNVYFSYASLGDVQNTSLISKDKQSITFNTTESENSLEFDITNASSQYDAVVSVTCIPESNENYTIENNVKNKKILAKDMLTSTINVKTNDGSENLKITCTLEVVAVSRVEKNTDEAKKRCKYDLGTEWNFDYKGSEQTFEVPCDAIYKVELWGAQGATNNGNSGMGGYVSGNIGLKKNLNLYIYTGEKGKIDTTVKYGSYLFNGGATGNFACYDYHSGKSYYSNAGGGATDIRLMNGAWNNFESLKSRIMVAAGGSSSNQQQDGVPGGGLIGYSGSHGSGGTQTAGGGPNKGGFGYGGIPTYGGNYCANNVQVGGGSGYYGGGAYNISTQNSGMYSSGGGSSFISGHQGCDAIQETSTSSSIQHTGQPNHYSGLIFSDTVMIDGAGYNWTDKKGDYVGMPTHDGKSKMTGNSGNGYAKITLIDF